MLNRYIFDTSVLIHHPESILQFPKSEIIIPLIVLEELDKLKILPNEVGKNSRSAIKILDSLGDNLVSGIILENKSLLKIELSENILESLDQNNNDNKILTCALKFKNSKKKIKTTLVSRDLNLRLKARSYGIFAENYEKDFEKISDLYLGFEEIIDPEVGYLLQKDKEIKIPNKNSYKSLFPNQCLIIKDQDKSILGLGRKINNKIKLVENSNLWGLHLKNKEQTLAADLLMDPKVPLVTLIGRSGTGKSLLALGASLQLVLEKKIYRKLIIYKPMFPIGNDIGFLPGDLSAKIMPWMESVNDSLDVLANLSSPTYLPWQTRFSPFLDRIELQPLTYIRGRSLPKTLILLEEGQSISLPEMKTLLTRLGEGSKIIITGDIEQIDNPNLDPMTNGLTHIIEKLKSSELTGHLTLLQGQRSALATFAANSL